MKAIEKGESLWRFAAVLVAALGLTGCVYAPPPAYGYGYAPPPDYSYPAPAYYYPYYPAPVVGSVGVFFGGRRHFR